MFIRMFEDKINKDEILESIKREEINLSTI